VIQMMHELLLKKTIAHRSMSLVGGGWCCVLVCAIMATSGCTLGPDYVSPEVELPSQWRTNGDDVLQESEIVWWEQYGDPVITSLVRQAVSSNTDIQIATERVDEFAARVGIIRSEALPQVDAGAAASQSQFSRETGPIANRVSDLYNASLNVGWEIDLWGRIRRAEESARADLLSVEENRRGVILTVVSSVVTGYINLRSLDEQLEVARRRLKGRAENVELFKLQLAQGVISELELAQVQSEYSRTATTIPSLERQVSQLENSISVLLGLPPGPIERGLELSELQMPQVPPTLPSDLLQQRPDLLAAEQELVSANARIGEAITNFYPRIALSGQLGYASDDLSNLSQSSASIYDLAFSVAAPLFTAGRLEGQLEAAEAVERGALASYIGTLLTALRESEDALVGRVKTIEEMQAQLQQLAALKKYEMLANDRYDNGYISYVEVLDAERSSFDSELDHVRLLASSLLTTVDVYKAFGGDWVTYADDIRWSQRNELQSDVSGESKKQDPSDL
jgi:outer membrane protein, multidrug efflux system